MGLDYIRNEAGQRWRKRWAEGLDRLKLPTFFDLAVTDRSRAVTAVVEPGASVHTGDVLIVQRDGPGVAFLNGMKRVAHADEVPVDVSDILKASGDIACAHVDRMSIFGDTIEASLR